MVILIEYTNKYGDSPFHKFWSRSKVVLKKVTSFVVGEMHFNETLASYGTLTKCLRYF